VLLGPYLGAISVGLGTLVGHFVYFRDPFELLFMIGAPLGSAVAGLIYQKRWRPVLGIYTLLLAGYFVYPVSWILPLWGIWDILVGYGLLLVYAFIVPRIEITTERLDTVKKLLFSTVIGLEADILLRVFILVPGQTYWLFYGLEPAQLQLLWVGAAFITPIKVALATIVSIVLGLSLMQFLNQDEIITQE
ncbi:MAG: hypothetical protein ACFE7R_02490, partial [Candidatus Hodarchaeota archaeon]